MGFFERQAARIESWWRKRNRRGYTGGGEPVYLSQQQTYVLTKSTARQLRASGRKGQIFYVDSSTDEFVELEFP